MAYAREKEARSGILGWRHIARRSHRRISRALPRAGPYRVMSRVCATCNIAQPGKNFSVRSDGNLSAWCKPCNRAYQRVWAKNRRQNMPKKLEKCADCGGHNKQRHQSYYSKCIKCGRAYHAAVCRRVYRTVDGKNKQKARSAVSAALESSRLKKMPCETCGNRESEAHHDDYSLPLDVRWLCKKHHGEVHHVD